MPVRSNQNPRMLRGASGFLYCVVIPLALPTCRPVVLNLGSTELLQRFNEGHLKHDSKCSYITAS